jgi:hypothetical protein
MITFKEYIAESKKPKHNYTIEKSYEDEDNQKGHNGWNLFHNGNWCSFHKLKRDAKFTMDSAIKDKK